MKATKSKAIKYNNQQEREWAIAQAEKMGLVQWSNNSRHTGITYRYIKWGELIWWDDVLLGDCEIIPLEKPCVEREIEALKSPNIFGAPETDAELTQDEVEAKALEVLKASPKWKYSVSRKLKNVTEEKLF